MIINCFFKQSKKIVTVVFLVMASGFLTTSALAKEKIDDWYFKNFNSEIEVREDGSLLITETIVADCGDLPGKHGIFRVLPTKIKVDGQGLIEMPVELISIQDQTGKEYKYTTKKDYSRNTIAWKIGDPEKTVKGENIYIIRYQVKNTLRFWNKEFDEFYWNLTGNFWDFEIEQAQIKVVFPDGINQENSKIWLYSGKQNDKGNQFATYHWSAPNVLEVETNQILFPGYGVTLSVAFPKDILFYHPLSWWERFWQQLFLLIPLIVFVFCFQIWKKHGKDPKIRKPKIAAYEPPRGFSILELGRLKDGYFKNNLFTAEIIYFATRGILTIKEIESDKFFGKKKDYEFTRLNNLKAENELTNIEQKVLEGIFQSGKVKKVSELENVFYKVVEKVKRDVSRKLKNKGYLWGKGDSYKTIFIAMGIVSLLIMFIFFSEGLVLLIWALGLASAILFFFATIMPKITEKGAQVKYQLENFKFFMETVDKDRAKFYEKENIFEKFLPYAIFFGITDLWAKRMAEIYGEEAFAEQAPVWYSGGKLDSFNFSDFNSSLSKVTSNISNSSSSSSGFSGGGGSGGGGGGGGGGGW